MLKKALAMLCVPPDHCIPSGFLYLVKSLFVFGQREVYLHAELGYLLACGVQEHILCFLQLYVYNAVKSHKQYL